MSILLVVACGSETAPDSAAVADDTTDELSTVDVVRQLTPSVVHVLTIPPTTGMDNPASPGIGVGTGIILQSDGYVLTNNHLIEGAESVVITLHNGESYTARVIGGDFNPDVAVVKIEAEGLQPARAGSVEGLEVGQDVIAIGHALALPGGPTVRQGRHQRPRPFYRRWPPGHLRRPDSDRRVDKPGQQWRPRWSTFRVRSSASTPPASTADRASISPSTLTTPWTVSRQLIEHGFVERGFLGIAPINLTPVIATQMGVPVDQGIVVARVVDGSDAQAAGLRGGDVIVSLNGFTIRNTGDLSKFLLDHPPGDRISVRLFRGGMEVETEAILGDAAAF